MNKSESISKLAVALVKFHSEVGRIAKDRTNPHFKNNYATLDQLIEHTRPILAANGLSVMQFVGGNEIDYVSVTTMIVHESGEYIEAAPLVIKPVKNDPQGMGSACTYAKRYSYGAILSLSTGEDDDAEAAQGRGNQAVSRGAQNQPQRPNTAPQTFTAPDGIIELWKGNYELAGMKYNKAVFDSWYTGQRQLGKSDQELENLLASKMAEKATANV